MFSDVLSSIHLRTFEKIFRTENSPENQCGRAWEHVFFSENNRLFFENIEFSRWDYPSQILKNLQNTWKSIRIDGNLYTNNGNPQKSKKNDEIHNIYGIYLCWKEKMGYILYSKHINASHICPSKRNQLFKQRKWKSRFSGKHGLWPAKHGSKSLFLWKHEMILRSLRSFCPSRFPIKP